jgi:hypothetical protein
MTNLDGLLDIRYKFKFKMLTIFTWNLAVCLIYSNLYNLKKVIVEIDKIIEG